MRLALIGVLVARTAAADCDDYQLFLREGKPVACTPSDCVDLTGTATLEAWEPPYAVWTPENSKACRGTTCRAVKPKLGAEIARRRKLASGIKHQETEMSFTVDHRLAVIGGPLPHPFEVWDIAKDVRLAIKPSPEHAKAQVSLATIVGNVVIIDWNDGLASVHDANGQRGTTFRAGLIAPLEETRAAVIGWTGTVTQLDLATGKPMRTDEVIKARVPFETDVLTLDPMNIALMWIDNDEVTAVGVKIPRNGVASMSPKQIIASCK